jgi:hypothetical protein
LYNNNNSKLTLENIKNSIIYKEIDKFDFNENLIKNVINFLYLQLVNDILLNRTLNEHIVPVINRLKGKRVDIEKLLDINNKNGTKNNFWEKNFIIINLHKVSLEMKKTIPLLIAKKLYNEHKKCKNEKTLNIIIDEAHNILSNESSREKETWKDYRLETFEEIIKEGRKFGVFITISSQRPSDISPTIISQAHNYFIHRLINQQDLNIISKSISYIDKISEESIPTLPIGTCIFSGVATQMPLKIKIDELEDKFKPQSQTLTFESTIEPKK